jgi:hypothetical protein
MAKYLLLIALFLTGCISPKKIFTSIEYSKEDSYGYTIENPILMGQFKNWQKNADLTCSYLSKLSYKNKSLKLVLHAIIKKPLDQNAIGGTISLRNRSSISINGKFLDLYKLIPRGTSDTLNLYFDQEKNGDIKTPKALEFNINQINTIFQ